MRIYSREDIRTWASFKNINLYINEKKILSDLNINFNYGENTVIMGPNGSGKSTLLRLLNRSIYPVNSSQSSFKLFNSENINIWELRKKIGFFFKGMEERVNKGVKLYELITSGFSGTFNSRYSKLLSREETEKVKHLIDEWQLNNIIHKEFHSLSDGQKRRALIARALVYEPNLLVLDEPFCNLDLKSQFILNKNLHDLIDKSVNILYVTHNLESILASTNRVVLIKEGRIITEGDPSEIINSRVLSDLFELPINIIKENSYWRGIPINN